MSKFKKMQHVETEARAFAVFDRDVFSFTITDGVVTAAGIKLPSGTTVAKPLSQGVTYTVDGADVLATRTSSKGVETQRFSDTDADGLYEVVASSKVMTAAPVLNSKGYSNRETLSVTLDTAGTTVTGVSEIHRNGSTEVLLSSTVTPPANVTWTVQQGLVVETITNTSGQSHWEVFRDGNNDGVFTEVASGNGALIDLVGVISATDAVAASL